MTGGDLILNVQSCLEREEVTLLTTTVWIKKKKSKREKNTYGKVREINHCNNSDHIK